MKKVFCLAALLCFSFAGCSGGTTGTAADKAKTSGANVSGAMGDAAKDGAAAVGDAAKDVAAAVGDAAKDGAAAVGDAAKEVVK